MQRGDDKHADEGPPQSGSYGLGAEGNRGSSAEEAGPKPVAYRGTDGRDDALHERIQGEPPVRMTAYDISEAHELLPDLDADELRRLYVLPPGSPLEENAKYIDVRHRERGEFQARAGMIADEAHWYVLKKDIDYELWNKLLGIEDMRRTGTRG